MNRSVTNFVGIAAVVFVFWMVARHSHPQKAIGQPSTAPDASGTTTDDGGGLMYAYGDSGGLGDDAGSLLWTDLLGAETRGDGGAGMTMPDGLPVPPLPFGVPRQVRFGVVLVTYAGAQPSVGGGRPVARSTGDARALADSLLATAQQDFHAAVQRGDTGSSDDIGRVKVGILEPAPEYVLFTLPVGGVGRPVDTPRGYWIVKRLE